MLAPDRYPTVVSFALNLQVMVCEVAEGFTYRSQGDRDTDKEREDVALLRFGVISDLVGATRLDHREFGRLAEKKSRQRWNIPHSGRTRLSPSTIRRGVSLYEYSCRQLTSLHPAPRSDIGHSRQVDEDTVLALVRLRKAKPTLPVARLIDEMVEKGLVLSAG